MSDPANDDVADETDHPTGEPADEPAAEEVDRLPAETARAVLEYLARSVVEYPDEVRVEMDESGSELVLNVSVADGDMGRVIGKRGRVANAIRSVGRAAAARDGVDRVGIEFVD